MSKLFKIKNLFSLVFILGSLTLSAQEKQVTDAELGQFADAYIKVQIQNQEAQKEMMVIIEGEGLEVQRFTVIQ